MAKQPPSKPTRDSVLKNRRPYSHPNTRRIHPEAPAQQNATGPGYQYSDGSSIDTPRDSSKDKYPSHRQVTDSYRGTPYPGKK